ncbi:MAG: hypothetical protein LLG97_06920 [Deltaproteobacteria bacterium]|nr:hypothetical protein [Deltaproteobacteria bacterium]
MAEEKEGAVQEHRGPGRPKQAELEGFEVIEDKNLRALVEKYDDLEEEVTTLRKAKNEANAKVVKYMIGNKINKVVVGGMFVYIDPGKAKAVVKERAPSDEDANVRRSGKVRKGAEEE